jgi:hypothetical protein
MRTQNRWWPKAAPVVAIAKKLGIGPIKALRAADAADGSMAWWVGMLHSRVQRVK